MADEFIDLFSGVTALHLALWNHGQMDIKTRGKIDSAQVVDTLLQAGAACHTEVGHSLLSHHVVGFSHYKIYDLFMKTLVAGN